MDDVRFPRTAKVEPPRWASREGTHDLVIQMSGNQTISIDLTDEELRRVRDAINKHLGE